MIDSLGDLKVASTDETRFREYVYSLLQLFGISVMMTQEVGELFGVTRLSEFGTTSPTTSCSCSSFGGLSDQTHHRDEDESERSRPQIREFEITAEGFVVGDHRRRPGSRRVS